MDITIQVMLMTKTRTIMISSKKKKLKQNTRMCVGGKETVGGVVVDTVLL